MPTLRLVLYGSQKQWYRTTDTFQIWVMVKGETRDRGRSPVASLLFPPWQVWTEGCGGGMESEGSINQGDHALQPPWAMEVLVHMDTAGPLAFADAKSGLRILILGGMQPLAQLKSGCDSLWSWLGSLDSPWCNDNSPSSSPTLPSFPEACQLTPGPVYTLLKFATV